MGVSVGEVGGVSLTGGLDPTGKSVPAAATWMYGAWSTRQRGQSPCAAPGVSADAFSRRLNVASNRANAGTRT